MKQIFKTIGFFLFIICLCSTDNHAQVSNTVKLISKRDGSDVKLRWAPINENIWLDQRLKGYRLSRLMWDQNNQIRPENYEVLADIKPLELDVFERKFYETDNKYLGIMAESIYGEFETIKPGEPALDNWVNKVEELKTKYTMAMVSADMDFTAAQSGGLAYKDSNLDPSKKYVYKLEALGDSVVVASVHVVLPSENAEDKVTIASSIEGEGQISLKWSRPIHEKLFTAYHIEKSKDGVNFTRLTDIPYINPVTDSYQDAKHMITFSEEVDNYDPHFYRVIGIDPFGDLSVASDSRKLQGRDLTPPEFPRIDSIISNEQVNFMNIGWTYHNSSPDWDKTVIQKSRNADGPFNDIIELPKLSQYYKDEDIDMSSRYYYRVCAVDTAGNYGCTGTYGGVINDKMPPIKPEGLNGVIDTNGVVTINWKANEEVDLKGYYVHFSNGGNRVFGNLSKKALKENIFRDTLDLNTLTETIEYKIIAVDQKENYSPFSDVLILKKPDLIPPSPAIFKSYKVQNEGIEITIKNSSSRDFKYTELLRKSQEGEFELIESFVEKDIQFLDTLITSNQKYTYTLCSYDDDGNQTYTPEELVVRTKDHKYLHPVDLTISALEDGIELKWTKPVSEEGKIVIYKLSGKRQSTLKTLSAEIANYVHTTAKTYSYQIRIEYSDGTHSAFSNIASL